MTTRRRKVGPFTFRTWVPFSWASRVLEARVDTSRRFCVAYIRAGGTPTNSTPPAPRYRSLSLELAWGDKR